MSHLFQCYCLSQFVYMYLVTFSCYFVTWVPAFLFCIVCLALCCQRNMKRCLSQSLWPYLMAIEDGVSPSISALLATAPRASNTSMTSPCPRAAATCSAVRLCGVMAFTLLPACRSFCTIPMRPLWAAMYNATRLRSFMASFLPESRNIRVNNIWPHMGQFVYHTRSHLYNRPCSQAKCI